MTHELLIEYENRALKSRVSMPELCERAGVAQSTITRWRKGKKPWMRTLRKLDNALEQIEAQRNA